MTFYKVTYRNMGADKAYTTYFDNKKDAYDFYDSRDYVDRPRAITVTKQESVEKYTKLCWDDKQMRQAGLL